MLALHGSKLAVVSEEPWRGDRAIYLLGFRDFDFILVVFLYSLSLLQQFLFQQLLLAFQLDDGYQWGDVHGCGRLLSELPQGISGPRTTESGMEGLAGTNSFADLALVPPAERA